MVKLIRNCGIRGEIFPEGHLYEGPDEAHLVNIGRAVFVEPEAAQAPPAEAMVVVDEEPEKIEKPKRTYRKKKKAKDD